MPRRLMATDSKQSLDSKESLDSKQSQSLNNENDLHASAIIDDQLDPSIREKLEPLEEGREAADRWFKKRGWTGRLGSEADHPVTHPVDPEAIIKPEEEESKGLLNRGYELYPTIGLALAAAVTQEWWIIDEYWVTGGCLSVAIYGIYLTQIENVLKRHRNGWNKQVSQTKAALGIRLDMLKSYEELETFALTHGEDLRALYAEERRVAKLAVEYENLKRKADLQSMILNRLRTIQNLEQDTRQKAVAALSKTAVDYVTKSFMSAPAAVKAKSVDWNINRIAPEMKMSWMIREKKAGTQGLAANDPLKVLFDEFLAKSYKPADLGVQDSVQRFLRREADSKKAKAPEAAEQPVKKDNK